MEYCGQLVNEGKFKWLVASVLGGNGAFKTTAESDAGLYFV